MFPQPKSSSLHEPANRAVTCVSQSSRARRRRPSEVRAPVATSDPAVGGDQSRSLRETLVVTRSNNSSARPAMIVLIAYSEKPLACSAVIAGGIDSS